MAGTDGKRSKTGQKLPASAITPMDRLRWSRTIARLAVEGKTWPEIAAETGMSQSKCRRLLAQLQASGDPDAPREPAEWVTEHLDALRITLDEAARTYTLAVPGSSAAIGALKLWRESAKDILELAARLGWVPQQLGALSAERAMQEMFREFAALAQEYSVSDEFLRAVQQLAERRLAPPAIEGTVVNIA